MARPRGEDQEEFNDFDPMDAIENLEYNNKKLQSDNLSLSTAISSQGFSDQDDQNLIHYQLETDRILERIERFLKGDEIKFSENGVYYTEPTKKILAIIKQDKKTGSKYYIQEIKEANKKDVEIHTKVVVRIINKEKKEIDVNQKDSSFILNKMKEMDLIDMGYEYIKIIDEDKKPFNEYGVAELMRIISQYVTKETFLSFYTEERIYEILADLGNSINNFLYCNYEKMGMDTKFKESKYTLIVINILHTIESCYRRAINGNEQEHLRTRGIVTQSQGMGMNIPRPQQQTKWNPLKPSTW